MSSTASEIDRGSPSRFRYRERDGIVWGGYDGDTVTVGRFLGTRTGDDLAISFVHVRAADGGVVTGTSASIVEVHDGALRLVETFRVDTVEHVSICVEVLPTDPPVDQPVD